MKYTEVEEGELRPIARYNEVAAEVHSQQEIDAEVEALRKFLQKQKRRV